MNRLCVALLLIFAWAAPAADAATVGRSADALQFGASPGEENRVAIALEGDVFRVTDPGARTLDGCDPVSGAPSVLCPAAGITRIAVLLGDGDDQLVVAVPLPVEAFGNAGVDLILTGDGPDQINGGPGADTVSAGGGDDRLIENDNEPNVLDGGAGADRIVGGDGDEQISGGPGDDPLLYGYYGDDTIDGGDGDDLLDGGPGAAGLATDADRLNGGAGLDTVTYTGHPAPVQVSIGDGAGDGIAGERDDVEADVERLLGSRSADVLVGGLGNDALDGYDGADQIDGGGGDDVLEGGGGDASADTLRGGDGGDRLSGGAGEDALDGGPGADTLSGGVDNDLLVGSSDADTLNGDDGDDRLEGGLGADLLTGGPGTDTVRYAADAPVEVTLDGIANDGVVSATPDGRTRVEEGGRSEGDNVDLTNESVDGSSVDDTVAGDARANALTGAAGEDYLDGRGGPDVLTGGGRGDTIVARDKRRDRVSCGAGSDYVVADRADLITRSADCEYLDDGSTTRPSALRDVTVDPRCGRGLDADLSPPGTRRSVPLPDGVRVPTGSRVDTLDCEVRLTAAVGGGRSGSGRLRRGTGTMAISQRRLASGAVVTRLRAVDCASPARIASARARVSRYPLPRYKRRFGRFGIPVELRLDTAIIRTRRGVATWEVEDECGEGATVTVSSGSAPETRAERARSRRWRGSSSATAAGQRARTPDGCTTGWRPSTGARRCSWTLTRSIPAWISRSASRARWRPRTRRS